MRMAVNVGLPAFSERPTSILSRAESNSVLPLRFSRIPKIVLQKYQVCVKNFELICNKPGTIIFTQNNFTILLLYTETIYQTRLTVKPWLDITET